MKTDRKALILIVLFAAFFLTGCSGILDGPHNQNGQIVPELLYANNGSDYITYWDDETRSYRTYDQRNNVFLETVAYSKDQVRSTPGGQVRRARGFGHSRNYQVSARAVMPLTELSPEEMKVQKEQGCQACHQS